MDNQEIGKNIVWAVRESVSRESADAYSSYELGERRTPESGCDS